MKKYKIAFAVGDQQNIRLTIQELTLKKISKAFSECQQGGKHENYIVRGGDFKKTELHISGTGHEWRDGHFRLDKNLLSACFLVLDLDAKSSNVLLPKEEQTAEKLSTVSATLELLGYNHSGYTSHSHQPDKGIHKSRVFVPCAMSSQSQLEPSVCKLVEELQNKGLDVIVNPEMLRWSQAWYMPTRDNPDDGFFEHRKFLDGKDFQAVDEGDYDIPASAKSSAYKGKPNREMRKDIKSGAHLHGPINNMIMQQAKEFVKRKTTRGKIITMAEKLFKLSPLKNDNQTYWKNEHNRLNENIDGAIRRAKQDKLDAKSKPIIKVKKRNKNKAPIISDELIFPPDEYGEFIRNVMESTIKRNNPVAAMVQGRGVLAFVCDGYGTNENLTPSGFDVVLGQSMVGKTLTSKAARRYLPTDSLKRIINKFTNGAAFEDLLIRYITRPSLLAAIDEIGLNLNTVKNGVGNSGGMAERLLEIATNGLDPIATRALAGKEVHTLHSPRLVTCGNTTIAALKGAITKKEVETGATNRQRFFDAEQNVTNKRANEVAKRNPKFTNKIQEIMKHSGMEQFKRCTDYIKVEVTEEVDNWIHEHDKQMLNNGEDNTLRGRHTESAISWAIPRAVFLNVKKPVINMNLFKWAYDIVEYSNQTIEYLYNVHLGDEDDVVEAETKLVSKLEDADGEMNKRDALNFRPYIQWNASKKNKFINALVELEVIEINDDSTPKTIRLIGE